MEDIRRAGDPRGLVLDIKEMDPTSTEKLTTNGKECSGRKTQQAHHTIMNEEVERSLSENSKLLTSERSLLSDGSINAIRVTKHAI